MTKKPIAVSLFAGAGGLDIGLEDAGFEVRCAVEWNKYACESLRINKELATASNEWFNSFFERIAAETSYSRLAPDKVQLLKRRLLKGLARHSYLQSCSIIEDDIRLVSSQTILEATNARRGEIGLVAGGPPCQSFSRAGKQASVDDDRGQLFMEFVRVVRDLKPRWFVFENVKGLVLTKTTIWKVRCSACGFETIPPFDSERMAPEKSDVSPSCETCNSPRTRWKIEEKKRAGALELIISEFERIGYECQPFVINAVDYGAPQQRERLFIVGSRDHERITVPQRTHFPSDFPSVHKSGEIKKQKTLWDALFSKHNPDHPSPLDPEVAVLWVKNVVRPHDEPVTWTLLRPSPTVGAHQSAKLAIAPFGVPPEQLARQQWHVLGRRQGDTKPVFVVHNYLSDADLLRLQTFPEFWFLAGTRMERAFQIGNAVPSLLAKTVGNAILNSAQPLSLDMKQHRQQLTMFEGAP
jgi:DNA (cytosine-5)-methyltransferase 1